MLRVLDIFSGAGGFSLGFALAGCEIVGAVEIDAWAAETFAFNHRDAEVLTGDINGYTSEFLSKKFSKIMPDIIIGGPPCQGFSICTKNAGDPKDPRNSLFSEFLRVVDVFSPNYVVMENVPNLIKARTETGESVITIIESELRKLGFNTYSAILEATNYGIPQIRKRLFVIGARTDLENPFPSPTHVFRDSHCLELFTDLGMGDCPSLWDAISDLPDIESGQGTYEMEYKTTPQNSYQNLLRGQSAIVCNHIAMKHSKRTIERFASMSWGDSVSDVPEHLKPYKRNSKGVISQTTYDQNNRRMHPDRPCHTIPASFYANFVHPFKNRNFTAREGARIQSFPDWFVFKGKPTVVSHKLLQREGRHEEQHLCQYSQIGNAVPPMLSKAIADNILAHIQRGKTDVRSWA